LDLFRQIVLCPADDAPLAVDLSWFEYYLPRSRRVSPRFLAAFGPPRAPHEPIEPRHADLAASVQARLEECLLALAQRLHRATGLDRLVYAGGVALNSLANGRLVVEGPFRELFVPPACGDAGTAAGAAMWLHEHLGGGPVAAFDTDALGPDLDLAALELELARSGLRVGRPHDIADYAAAAVARGAVIGWYQGRMEYGPRALGQRSLIADPRSQTTFERLNREIKFREPFRPYAPAVLVERVGEFFEPALDCPFMLQVLRVRESARARIPAVTHADGTARVQTVSRQRTPLYYDLIAAFERQAGVPVVLNTSFNVKSEPIVACPGEALAMLVRTGLDALAIGPYWVEASRV
jgi:carbamoyltransferase